MRKMLAAMGLAAGIVATCGQGAGALPVAAMPLKSAAAAPSVEQVQFRGYRTRHHIVKCYRTLVIGPYRCHYFRRHWW